MYKIRNSKKGNMKTLILESDTGNSVEIIPELGGTVSQISFFSDLSKKQIILNLVLLQMMILRFLV